MQFMWLVMLNDPNLFKTARRKRKGRLGGWIDFLEWWFLGSN